MNMLEINLIRGCSWNVGISLPKFTEWRGMVELAAEQAAEQRGAEEAVIRDASSSPSCSTDLPAYCKKMSALLCPSTAQPGALKDSGLARLIVLGPDAAAFDSGRPLATTSSSATTIAPICRRPSSPTPEDATSAASTEMWSGSEAGSILRSPSTCGPEVAHDSSPPFGAPHCARRAILKSSSSSILTSADAPSEGKGAGPRRFASSPTYLEAPAPPVGGMTVLRIMEVPAGLR